MKMQKIMNKVIKATSIATLIGVSLTSYAVPGSFNYLFNYKRIGIRDYAPSYAPYYGGVASSLPAVIQFVAPVGTSLSPPYFTGGYDSGSGDVLFVEANYGATAWAGYTDTYITNDNGPYGSLIDCFDANGNEVNICGKIKEVNRARLATVKFNNYSVDYICDNAIDNHPTSSVTDDSKICGVESVGMNGASPKTDDNSTVHKSDLKRNIIAHEFGHVLGMAHEIAADHYNDLIECYANTQIAKPSSPVGVMEKGSYCIPLYTRYSPTDLSWITSNYQ